MKLAAVTSRTVVDHTRKVSYFESTLGPNIVPLKLKNLGLAKGSGMRAAAVETDFMLIADIDNAMPSSSLEARWC